MADKKEGLKGARRIVLALLYIFGIFLLFYGLVVKDGLLILSGGFFFICAIYVDIKCDNLLDKLGVRW